MTNFPGEPLAHKSNPKSTRPVSFDQKFWKSFAKSYWEKKPLHVRNMHSSLREISDAEIFDLLVRYSDRCRKRKDPEGFKFYIDGFQSASEDVLQVLPEKSDKSLLGYHARMEALFSDYCLVCDELLRVSQDKQHLLTDFTDELYRHVGFPNRFAEMGLYLGNYRQTPFGVHVDSCGVFSFPVVGTKKFRLWTSAFAKNNPSLDRSFRYNKFKKDSKVLVAGPGDMTYWPSSAWHIAESDGSFTATWSLGVWVDVKSKDLISESFSGLLEKKMGAMGQAATTPFDELHMSLGEVTELPETYRHAMELILQMSPTELEETFLKSWMKHISLQGLKTISQTDFQISQRSRLRLRSFQSLILWRQSESSRKMMTLGFGGVLIETPMSSGLMKLIKAFNAGETCLIGSYLKGSNSKKDLTVLQKLANAGAFSADSH